MCTIYYWAHSLYIRIYKLLTLVGEYMSYPSEFVCSYDNEKPEPAKRIISQDTTPLICTYSFYLYATTNSVVYIHLIITTNRRKTCIRRELYTYLYCEFVMAQCIWSPQVIMNKIFITTYRIAYIYRTTITISSIFNHPEHTTFGSERNFIHVDTFRWSHLYVYITIRKNVKLFNLP